RRAAASALGRGPPAERSPRRSRIDTPCRSGPTAAPVAAAPARRCAASALSPPRAARAARRATLYVSRSCASSSLLSPSFCVLHRYQFQPVSSYLLDLGRGEGQWEILAPLPQGKQVVVVWAAWLTRLTRGACRQPLVPVRQIE